MPVIRAADCRRSETPNAVMTTLASPTQGGAGLAVWRVEMHAGRQGPYHAFDAEQVWTFLDGAATVELAGRTLAVGPGDTLVMPANAARQVTTGPAAGCVALVAAPGGALAYNPDGRTPQNACDLTPRDTDRVLPPWTA